MNRKFKINDLVEVTKWKGDRGKDWIIIDLTNNGYTAIISNIFSKARTIVLLSDLKHQKKEVKE